MGVRWLVDPAGAAGDMGMPLLEGLGLSSQIGDLGAFFFCGGAMVLLGALTGNRVWFQAPALLLATTAVFRGLAWAVHGATLAVPQIAVEVVLTALLLAAATRLSRK